MRVLLISANTEQLQMPVLPMGLACVATATQEAGHEVRLLNLMTRNNTTGLLENAIADFRPEAIGISVRNIDDQQMGSAAFLLDAARDVVSMCRRFSSAPIILGGAGYSIYPESTLSYLGADMGIQGEGESALPMLLDRLARKEKFSDVPNLFLPGRPWAGKRAILRELDRFRLPVANGFITFPAEFRKEAIWLPFQTRRGCPMECSFCSTATIEGRILRRRSVESVMESLIRFAEAGFTNIFFVDNTFNFPASYAGEICDRIIASGIDIRWRCILYPWKVTEGLIEKMACAGCVEVSFGFESGSEKILRAMNKRFHLEELRRISALLDKYEITRMGFLMLGGPGETRETVSESLQFADSLDLESGKVTTGIRIYPYTALADIARREGMVPRDGDLLRPAFYLEKKMDGWLQETVSEWLSTRRNWFS